MTNKKSAPTAATVQSAITNSQVQFTPDSGKTQAPESFNECAEIEELLREAYIDGKSGTSTYFYAQSEDAYLAQFQKINGSDLTSPARTYVVLLWRVLRSAYEAGRRAALKGVATE